jgi:hypothetical protein
LYNTTGSSHVQTLPARASEDHHARDLSAVKEPHIMAIAKVGAEPARAAIGGSPTSVSVFRGAP